MKYPLLITLIIGMSGCAQQHHSLRYGPLRAAVTDRQEHPVLRTFGAAAANRLGIETPVTEYDGPTVYEVEYGDYHSTYHGFE